MYDQFYNLRSEPFRLSPDHAFAYAHKGYVKARAYMAYAFMRAEGFVMITGRPGTGKTTLVGALVDQLAGEDVSVANLVCTQLQADDLLKLVAYEFGIGINVVEKGVLLQHLTLQLRSWHRDGRRALLIVDEAQDLSISAMEELRLLTNIQIDGKPLLQIFLLGQPELRELVLSPALEQVHQRIVAASHLRALELDETEAYILHRLEVVGWRGDPMIHKAVYPLIHKYSEGIPRRINLICSRLFLQCAVEQRHKVELEDLREVVRELQEENLAAGTSYSEDDFRPAENAEADIAAELYDPPQPSPDPVDGLAQQGAPAGRKHEDLDSFADKEPPDRAMQISDAGTGDEVVWRDKGKRHQLKVIGGSASRVSARKTGTRDEVLETFPEPAEHDTGAWVDAVQDEPAERVVERRSPAHSIPPASKLSTQLPLDTARFRARVEAPVSRRRRARNWYQRDGIVEILLILAVSIGLVAWAISGFDLGLFLD